MSKLSNAWNTLVIFNVNPRDAKSRADARYQAAEYLVPGHPDQTSASDAQSITEALDVVEARLGQKGK